MRTRDVILTVVAACASIAGVARAQQPAQPAPATTGPATPAGPAVRSIGQITSVSSDTFSAVAAAVEVGGRVLINDILARRVLLYDSTLAHATVVEDSEAGSVNAYGPRPGTLLPFRGDSALFIAPASLSMQVLSPEGQIARVMAMPPGGGGLSALLGNIFGTPGFDAHGRLAYFTPARFQFRAVGTPGGAAGPMTMEPADSAFVVRFDFATRTLDTAATIRIPRTRTIINRDESGRPGAITTVAFPPLTVDDWAVMSDGSIAVLRGRDYHIDWLNADGSWTSSPRLPFAWEHVNDEEKQALIDSTATAMQTLMDSMAARMERQRASGAAGPGGAVVIGGGGDRPPPGGPPGGGGGMQITIVAPREGAAAAGVGPGGPGGGPTQTISIPRPTVTKATLAEVPDYRPPIRQGALRADAEGNLWIRTTRMVGGRPVYDVVNRAGQLVDRVQLPPFRTIAGFGPGVVYMGVRDSSGTNHLERARIR